MWVSATTDLLLIREQFDPLRHGILAQQIGSGPLVAFCAHADDRIHEDHKIRMATDLLDRLLRLRIAVIEVSARGRGQVATC
jgi:hypothetical protein